MATGRYALKLESRREAGRGKEAPTRYAREILLILLQRTKITWFSETDCHRSFVEMGLQQRTRSAR